MERIRKELVLTNVDASARPRRRWVEFGLESLVRIVGFSSIGFVVLIFLFLMREGMPFFLSVPLSNVLSTRWYPTFDLFGIWPLVLGSIGVTVTAIVIALPLGVATAVFVREVAPAWARDLLKPLIEVLAGIPSVVLGFFGMTMIAPLVREILGAPTGLTAFAGGLILAYMALPTLISVAEDALDAVPKSYRDAGLAMGATRWQTIREIVLPQALPGILTGVILGLERAAGETAPILFTVAAFYLPQLPQSLFDQTMALPYHLYVISTQVPGMPIQIQYGTALVLLIFVLSMNLAATLIRSHYRKRRQW